ncbi:hypothetical protein SARC_02564 [Sphaeroforma arctica JP610]|uniref:Uncharacterized protein n=1 Tax=Sphaeroforma arctica JP610 TaxID=667725 RepID=A0A0L0G8J6_9EUKA|nr:hypothetical protein SARC_02564 [Sphaeroforma arctica JP610]KNC85229.1 hypothetical protein SARC_02564 [Sphaeroforma arctica JP610]|eukprot:XP_014159131.1 hypothetical protein SARC_02564 [Sphaeroforma arctica JP610]
MSNLSGGLSSEDLLLTPNSSSISPPKIPAKPNTQCPNPNSIPESSPPCTSTTEPLSGPGIPSAANSGTTPTPLLAARPKRGSLLNINTIPNEQRTSTKPRVRWDNQVVLFHAASTGDLDEVKEQVKTAGLDSTNELNMHAMHYAVYGGQLEVIKFMVESGATLDTKNTDGNTPLYLALIEEEDAIALYFMAKGSDLHYENCGGCSAYDLAESKVMKAAISEMDKASRRNSGAKTDPAPEKEDGGLTSSLRRTPLIPVTQTAGVM